MGLDIVDMMKCGSKVTFTMDLLGAEMIVLPLVNHQRVSQLS